MVQMLPTNGTIGRTPNTRIDRSRNAKKNGLLGFWSGPTQTPVQPEKKARSLKFQIQEEEWLFYLYS